MQTFKINIPQEVLDEIEYYVDIIAQDSVQNAVKWYFNIKQEIQTLNEFPARCPYANENIFHDYEIRNLIFGNYQHFYGCPIKASVLLKLSSY